VLTTLHSDLLNRGPDEEPQPKFEKDESHKSKLARYERRGRNRAERDKVQESGKDAAVLDIRGRGSSPDKFGA